MRAGLMAVMIAGACSSSERMESAPAPPAVAAGSHADAMAEKAAQAPDRCEAQVARIRGVGDSARSGLEEEAYANTYDFDRSLVFPGPVAGLREVPESPPLGPSTVEIRGRSIKLPRQVPGRGTPPVLYVAADASLPLNRLAATLAQVPTNISVRLLVQRPPAEWVEKFLRAFPETPAAFVDLFRREPKLGPAGPDTVWAEALIAAGAGCRPALAAIGTMLTEMTGLIEAPALADAYQTCACKMADPAGLEALVVFALTPRSDLGWLPLRVSSDAAARDLGLGTGATVADLAAALGKLARAEQDQPFLWRGR